MRRTEQALREMVDAVIGHMRCAGRTEVYPATEAGVRAHFAAERVKSMVPLGKELKDDGHNLVKRGVAI